MDEDIAFLREKRICLAHQSVRKNILAGITDLSARSSLGALHVVDLGQESITTAPGLYHERVGTNTQPQSKYDAFSAFTVGAAVPGFDLVALKFCYVDVNRSRDIGALLDSYQLALEGVRRNHPNTVILNVTIPLKTAAPGMAARLKRFIGGEDPTHPDNIRRCEYNEILKRTFAGEPIFDLAEVQSTYPDGRRESFVHGGKTHYRLIQALSNDGGHLNEAGRRVAAEAMVHAMASVLRSRNTARG